MKSISISFFILLSAVLLVSTVTKDKYPNERVQSNLIADVQAFQQQTTDFLEATENHASAEELLNNYKKTRAAYKKIETYVVFRYPGIDKVINGGPVPSMEVDVVIIHKDDPSGLQVIEELMADDLVNNYEAIAKNLRLMEKKAQILEFALESRPIQNWEILEANHLAITKLITMGLSGFDSPVYLLAIEDAQVVLSQMNRDLSYYEDFVEESYDFKTIQSQLNTSIAKLEGQDFEGLNRFNYFRDQLLPLQTSIQQLHKSTGYETYYEVTNVKRSVSTGSNLFEKDYLDPFFSTRGGKGTYTKEQIELGKILFFDPILSGNNKRACASCHAPDKAFADGVAKSMAFNFEGEIKRNSPTLINSAYQSNFFWDLRSDDMNDQIVNVIMSHDEFNTSSDEIVEKLKQSNEYRQLFSQAFVGHQEPINIGTVKSSLETYVRTLTALDSKFDKNIRGESNDLTESEILGANLFMGKAACATCHFPPNFNGFVPPHYRETEGEILGTTSNGDFTALDPDDGMYERFRLSYPEATYTKGMFKTPTIRNIELTGPYMHNGMFNSLETVVDFYNEGGGLGHGLDVPQQTLAADSLFLNENEKMALVAFMKTLTDTVGTNVMPFELPKMNDPNLNNRTWGGEY